MKDLVRKKIEGAITKLIKQKEFFLFNIPEFQVEYPDQEKFGDYSTNIAMVLASQLKKNPMEIAQKIADELDGPAFTKVEVAPPGFINFFIGTNYLNRELAKILNEKNNYGKKDLGKNKKIQLEFVSGNPTGPLHIGNGRGGFTGDVLTNVLRKEGYKPYKEYYINDFGNQIDTLGESVMRRYFQAEGVKVDFPDELYQGDYIKDLAKEMKIDNFNIADQKKFARVKDKVQKEALEKMIKNTQDVLQKKCGIKYNQWFRESSLYENDAKDEMLEKLKKKELIYVKEGAIWFKSKKFGDDKDRVIIKTDGSHTYFFSDILYMENRLKKRKYSKVIMILGADHHGDVARLNAAAEILDKKEALDVIIYQNVQLIFKGKELKMSKRKGVFVTLEELVEEVGIDAMRFFFLMNSLDKHMDFDISLAKEKSDKNPVYYVQYAHARICSILAKIKKVEPPKKIELREPAEKALLNEIIKLPDIVEEVAKTYEVHKLPFYSIDIARKFHNFYNQCRVIEDDKVNASRVELIKATKQVLGNVLALMGVSAPKKM